MSETVSSLKGQTILILGGSSGIGFGVAFASLTVGASKVIIGSSSAQKVSSAVDRLVTHSNSLNPARGGEVKGVAFNANDLASVKKVVEEVGEINHLVFSCGSVDVMTKLGSLDTKLADVQKLKDGKIFDIGLWAAIQAIQSAKFAPGGSATITTGSTYQKPYHNFGISSGLTGALAMLVKGLASDLAPEIRVNCVAVGLIDTELFDGVPAAAKEIMFREGAEQALVKRAGEPADTAEAYIFLMKRGFITGQTIDVNGGLF